MKINYRELVHERTEDAPFVGALISALNCNLGCEGCFNSHLDTLPLKARPAKAIIREVKSNPLNQGIIFGGREWTLQVDEMLELIQEAVKNDLQIMIYTGHNIDEFFAMIGKACADKVGLAKPLNLYQLQDEDVGIYSFMGRMVMDYFIPNDYYVKTGKYDATKLVDDNIQFGIKLASANQKIYEIKKVVEGEEVVG